MRHRFAILAATIIAGCALTQSADPSTDPIGVNGTGSGHGDGGAGLDGDLGSANGGVGGGSSDGGAGAGAGPGAPGHDVLLIGNSVSGTVSFVDGHTFAALGAIDVIPDLEARLDEINSGVVSSIAYAVVKRGQIVKHFEPSNGDRFVDDVFVSPDGATLYVSRSNLADVAAFDLTKPAHPMRWRTHVDGFKADHATLSPDGTRLVVSATSADKAQVIDAATGNVVGAFATGHFPHQNDYSADGKHIYNGSIGDVGLPSALDAFKGKRQLTVVDAKTLAVVRTYAFAEGIRPAVITSDEKLMYAQLSFLNGLVEYDLTSGTIARTLEEPRSAFARANYPTRDDYPHDSAHHGLALSGDGAKLCDAGTIDNNVSIVSTATMTVEKTIDVGLIPYWATTSADGKHCFVSLSGDNAVSVIDYAAAKEVVRVPVGKFPQRSRLGKIKDELLASIADKP
jgi:YVTN family beta-propeller protein